MIYNNLVYVYGQLCHNSLILPKTPNLLGAVSIHFYSYRSPPKYPINFSQSHKDWEKSLPQLSTNLQLLVPPLERGRWDGREGVHHNNHNYNHNHDYNHDYNHNYHHNHNYNHNHQLICSCWSHLKRLIWWEKRQWQMLTTYHTMFRSIWFKSNLNILYSG